MVDIYLMQMLKGGEIADSPHRQNEFQNTELEKEVEILAQEMADDAFQNEPQENQLLPPQIQKNRLKQKFKEELLRSDDKSSLEEAIEVLNEQMAHRLNHDQRKLIADEFAKAIEKWNMAINNPDLDENITLQNAAGLSDQVMDHIEGIAREQYGEGQYLSCKKIYAFLTILNHHEFEYWHRLGISLHELKEYENAIHAYQEAEDLDQESIPNKLFAAECFLALNNKQKALEFYKAAKKLLENENSMDQWSKYLSALEESIATLA